MSDHRCYAIERVRAWLEGQDDPTWDDIRDLLADYDQLVCERDHLAYEIRLAKRRLEGWRALTGEEDGPLAIAREALEEIDGAYSDNDEGYRALAQVAREALRRMSSV